LAWIRQAQGDREGALEAMAEAERVAPGPGLAGVLNPVPAQRARLLLAQGDVAEAARWADERGLSADDEPSYPSEPEHLVLARLLLAQDRTGEALTLLERWLAAAVADGRTGSVLQLRTLLALALAASGDQARALSVLVAALSLACPHGYVRVFAGEGAAMGAPCSVSWRPHTRPGRPKPAGFQRTAWLGFRWRSGPGTRGRHGQLGEDGVGEVADAGADACSRPRSGRRSGRCAKRHPVVQASGHDRIRPQQKSVRTITY
jgi:MalT-like TPR region